MREIVMRSGRVRIDGIAYTFEAAEAVMLRELQKVELEFADASRGFELLTMEKVDAMNLCRAAEIAGDELGQAHYGNAVKGLDRDLLWAKIRLEKAESEYDTVKSVYDHVSDKCWERFALKAGAKWQKPTTAAAPKAVASA